MNKEDCIIVAIFAIVGIILLGVIIYVCFHKTRKYFNSEYDKAIHNLRRPLVSNFARFFSHGGIHLSVMLIAFFVAWYFYEISKKNMSPTPHKIMVNVEREPYHRNKDSIYAHISEINFLRIEVLLNSDSVLKRSNEIGNSSIRISYHSNKCDTVNGCWAKICWHPYTKSPTYVRRDTMRIYEYGNDKKKTINYKEFHKICEMSDSSIVVSAPPLNNIVAPITHKLFPGTQDVEVVSNDLGVNRGDPYYYYYIILNWNGLLSDEDLWIELSLSVGETFQYPDQILENQSVDLKYNYIFPEPDLVKDGKISFYKPEKIEQIRINHGILFQAEDISALNQSNHDAFFYSVIVGLFAAFVLDVLVQLVRELRDLNRDHERNNNSRSELLLTDNMEKKEDEDEKESETENIEQETIE